MADPFGIIGLIGIAVQVMQATVQFSLDWKDAPAEARSFKVELQALKTVLSETNTNILLNPDFLEAFQGRPSVLLSQLGGDQDTDTKTLISICHKELECMLQDLEKRSHGHHLGWERLKGAFLAKNTRDAVAALQRQCQMLNSLLAIDGVALSSNIYKEVKESREEQQRWQRDETVVSKATKAGVDTIHAHQQRQEQSEEARVIIDWLAVNDFSSQQIDFIRRRQPGTGQWLLQSTEYNDWIDGGKRTLYCPGIPGAGKTIITSIVVNDLYDTFAERVGDDVVIAYVYCNFKRQVEQTLNPLLSSLLKQLVQCRQDGQLPSSVRDLFDRHSYKRTRPSTEEIDTVLKSACRLYSRVFLVVDALDECQTTDGCRANLINELKSLRDIAGSRVSIFATSRYIPDIMKSFEGAGCAKLEIRAMPEDVRRFLLAQLHLASLVGKRSANAVEKALAKLPSGSDAYDAAYEDALRRIEGQVDDVEQLGKDVLSWLTCARRPLNTEELRQALAVEEGVEEFDERDLPDIEDMVSACAGLVTVDDESSIIRLVHYTTQEYLERTKGKWFPNIETKITEACVKYLSFRDFDGGFCPTNDAYEARVQTYRFYEYASQNWGHHARQASALAPSVIEFLSRKRSLGGSCQAMLARKRYPSDKTYSQDVPKDMRGIHFAARFGLEGVMKRLLEDGHFPDWRDSWGRTPLWWAAESGNDGITRMLLAEDIVRPDARDFRSQTPLWIASCSGHLDTVKLLLATRGVNIDSRDHNKETPLLAAVRCAHRQVIELLLRRGANPNAVTKLGRTSMWRAAVHNDVDLIKLLVNVYGCDPKVKTSDGETPLFGAALVGREEALQILLELGVDPNLADYKKRTPLEAAVMNGRNTVAERLLELDTVDPDCKNTDGMTPLLIAARRGSTRIAELIASRITMDLEYQARWRHMKLLWAAKSGDAIMVRELLEDGVFPDPRDCPDQETPLILAARMDRPSVIKLLLADSRIDCNAADSPIGQTALSWAAENGNNDVVRLLLNEPRVDPDKPDRKGRTPLYFAAWNGNAEAMRLLIDTKRVDNNVIDTRNGKPMIVRAADRARTEAVDVLLTKAEVDPNQKCWAGRTALSIASEGGHDEIVQRLLSDERVDREAADNMGRTPLSWAASAGKDKVVSLLLEAGADVNVPDNSGDTPLIWASKRGHCSAVSLLLEGGADINVGSHWTALHWAVRNGRTDIEEILKSHGVTESGDFFGLNSVSCPWQA